MADYQPLDISSLCNAGLAILGEQGQAPTGRQSFHGLPFLIGHPEKDNGTCFLGCGTGLRMEPLTIPVGLTAQRVIVAHRLLESNLEDGGPLGKLVAEYLIHLADGRSYRVPVRERFEISIIPENPWLLPVIPFCAVPDNRPTAYPRYEGRWEDAGRRREEINRAPPQSYYLWVWSNPDPGQTIASLEIVPQGPRFIVAGITLGQLDEHPFVRYGTRELMITLPQPTDAARPFDIHVEVDRGVTTYPYSLPLQSSEQFLADQFKGWGEDQNLLSSRAYVKVAAVPSATITVKHDGQVLGAASWGEIETHGSVEPSARLRLELVDRGRNWVHTTVLDDDTGQPVPCRIHFRSSEGIPFPPHGHPEHVNSNLDTYNTDVGGDVRLGQMTYAYIDGTCQGWLPRGEVWVDVARGFEYEPLRTYVTIQPGQRELVLRLKRWRNMNAERWFSGDTHVHFLSTQGGHIEAQAEDLNVVNLLMSQWGHHFSSSEEFTGRPSVSPDGRTIVYVGQETRNHTFGHLNLLGLRRPVMPWCSDGPSEAELAGTLEATLGDWADQCHAQDGLVLVAHHPVPNGEQAALIASERTDGIEMIRHTSYHHLEYYRYLNCGYRLPLVGGTDKMSNEVPIGLYRTYVYIPEDEEFTFETWCRNLARGRTFLSAGPLLRFSVDGQNIGDTLILPKNGGTVEVAAEADSIFPMHTLEIVQQGRVIASTEDSKGARSLRLRAKVRVEGHTWLAARAGGPGYFQSLRHHDVWRRGVFAHTSPVYVACGEEWWLFDEEAAHYMLTLIDGALAYIRTTAIQWRPGTVTHHHGETDHLSYLERPFLQGREAISRRLKSLGKQRGVSKLGEGDGKVPH